MAPKKVTDSGKPKRKVMRATLEVKKQMIGKHECRMHLFDLAVNFLMPKSTKCLILKNKDVINAAD